MHISVVDISEFSDTFYTEIVNIFGSDMMDDDLPYFRLLETVGSVSHLSDGLRIDLTYVAIVCIKHVHSLRNEGTVLIKGSKLLILDNIAVDHFII